MKALTIRQPWADAIAQSTKRVENRTWPLPARHVGARILIHAAAALDRHAALPPQHPANGARPGHRSAVIAVATLTGCHLDDGCCAPWGQRQVFHWALTDVVPLDRPVPCRGALGLWTPPGDVLTAVSAQFPVAS
jgi:hypothetical protein